MFDEHPWAVKAFVLMSWPIALWLEIKDTKLQRRLFRE